MGIISLLAGSLSLAAMFLALLPDLGVLAWLALPIAAAGVVIGLTAMARRQQRPAAVAGIVCSGLATVAGAVILGIGRGVI